MAKLVEIPDVGMVEFPDTMSDEDICSTIEKDIVPNYAAKKSSSSPLTREQLPLSRPVEKTFDSSKSFAARKPENGVSPPKEVDAPAPMESLGQMQTPSAGLQPAPLTRELLPLSRPVEKTFDSSKSFAARKPEPKNTTPEKIEVSPIKPLADLPIVSAGLQPSPLAKALPSDKSTPDTEKYVAEALPANTFEGKPFAVVDKKLGVATVFDPSGKILRSMPAMTGRRVGDKVIEDGESYRTPSGVFDAEFYDSEDYGPAVRFARYGSNNMLAHEYAKHSKTNPGSKRLEALKNRDTKALRGSSGCVNLLPDDAKWLSGFANKNKMKWVVLPETEEGFQTHPSFQTLRNQTARK